MNLDINVYRGVNIVISSVEAGRWFATWIFPGEKEAVRIDRTSQSLALGYAKKQVDQFFSAQANEPVTAPPFPTVWRKGEDWWSGIEVENGVVPSDAVPYYGEDEL